MSVVLFVCFILTNVHKRSMKKRQSFQQMLLEKLDIHGRKNKNKQTNKKNIKKKKKLRPHTYKKIHSNQRIGFCCCHSVTKSCLTLCDLMDCSTSDFLVLHHLPEFAQTHVHLDGDAIQPSHPLSSPSPSAFNHTRKAKFFKIGENHQHLRLGRVIRLNTKSENVKVLVIPSCLTLCDPIDCSLPGSCVHRIIQQEYWSGQPFLSPTDLPDPGTEPRSLALQTDSLPSES